MNDHGRIRDDTEAVSPHGSSMGRNSLKSMVTGLSILFQGDMHLTPAEPFPRR